VFSFICGSFLFTNWYRGLCHGGATLSNFNKK
jgi:hypothetical protein